MASAKEKRQHFKKSRTAESSYYQRDNTAALVQNLHDEIAKNLSHTVTLCDYYMRGVDHNGLKTINQYSIIRELGEGAFGKVYLVHVNETHEDLAMKVYSKTILASKKDQMVKDPETGKLKHKNYLMEIKKEIEIMQRLSG